MSEHQKKPESETPGTAEEAGTVDGASVETVTVESLQAELEKMKDQWMRALAEGENSRRRAAKEREDTQKFAISNFARELLSVADNLRRALDNCPPTEELSEATKSLVTGVDMTEKELLSILERQGVKKLNPLYEKFDPNFHQAMFEVETGEHESGKIIQVLQHGYVLHERLLRPALVGVAKPVSATAPKVDTMA
ncbi:nucleotide exchange factor GrpE [Candidatus Paracaedibacter symbiosus]|uniref:nucleotide exchange factor GrpE n=1 Tax=Candidatus Paracaedibacter symbiosus TaxID=244582 RepID=UPI00068BB8B2|nr:nucleotide exchange factor GrpE [Candidatus Paracaedibacter symbiosus]